VTRRTVDVSHLPTYAFGPRDTHWWATVLTMAIEGTMMVLLSVSYFYVRKNYTVWPPQRLGDDARIAAAIGAALVVASVIPAVSAARAAKRGSLAGMQRGVSVAAFLGAGALLARVVELERISVRWDSQAYGSVVWMLLGMHTLHAVTGVLENLVLVALLFTGPVEKKHLCDVDVTMLFWLFIVAEQIPIFLVLYFDPVFFAH
jgi:cytochrome c oxidase subunit 3